MGICHYLVPGRRDRAILPRGIAITITLILAQRWCLCALWQLEVHLLSESFCVMAFNLQFCLACGDVVAACFLNNKSLFKTRRICVQ